MSDKKLILISGASDVKIKNSQSNFQNYLHDRFYLDQSVRPLGLSLDSISVDFQFKNPVCSIDEKYPQLIVAEVGDFKKDDDALIKPIIVKRDVHSEDEHLHFLLKERYHDGKNSLSPFDFKNEKFYLKSDKRYTLTDLYNEWTPKQNSVYKNIRKNNIFGGQFMKIYENSFWFGDYERRSQRGSYKERTPYALSEALIFFFHEKFFNALDISSNNALTHDGEYTFNNEKYFYFINFQRHGMMLKTDDPGLYFKTPNLMKIVCKQITMIEDDNKHSQVIATAAINEEDKFKHKEYKFNGEETFPIQSISNDHIEILLLDENNERIILANSLPTVVTLNVKMLKNDEFHIRFSSDNKKYPSNTPTNFKYLMNAPAMLNEEYHVALVSTNFKNEFLPDKSFDFYFKYYVYDDDGASGREKKISLNENCLNANDIYRNFISKINELRDYQGHSIIKANENNDGILTFTYHRNASFTFSYHLTRILGIREQNYQVSQISDEIEDNDPNRITGVVLLDDNDENAGTAKKPKLHESFDLKYAIHSKAPELTGNYDGTILSYLNEIRNVTKVSDLVTQFIDIFNHKKHGMNVKVEDSRLKIEFNYDVKIEIHPHLANILGFTNVSRLFSHLGRKGSQYTTSHDILHIDLSRAAPKDLRKYKFLEHMEDAVIEIYNDDHYNKGGTYTCSVPVNKEYQIEQKMIFIESNIVKSSPVAHGNGKILKTIVMKKPGVYDENNFSDKPEFVPLQHDTFQTIEIKFKSLAGNELVCKDPKNNTTYCHLLIRRLKKAK